MKKTTKNIRARDHKLAKEILELSRAGYDELHGAAPKAAMALTALGSAVAALGEHTPGWSGSLGALTKPALGGLH